MSKNTPVNIFITVNAGYIESGSWVHDPIIGGGRIIGEACHFFDLCTFFTDSNINQVCSNSIGSNFKANTDNLSILLRYDNGSNAVINYFSNGSKSYSKERIEVHSQQTSLILDNWRKLKGYGIKGFSSISSSQDKGHKEQFKKLLYQHIKGGKPIIPFNQIVNTTKATLAAIESLSEGKDIDKIKLYYNTIIYLKPRQIFYRFLFQIKKSVSLLYLFDKTPVETKPINWNNFIENINSFNHDAKEFTFLNISHCFNQKIDWNF